MINFILKYPLLSWILIMVTVTPIAVYILLNTNDAKMLFSLIPISIMALANAFFGPLCLERRK